MTENMIEILRSELVRMFIDFGISPNEIRKKAKNVRSLSDFSWDVCDDDNILPQRDVADFLDKIADEIIKRGT